MTKRVVAVLEARMGSSRLPGKSMRPLAGAPLVERIVERVKRAKSLDAVVVATTENSRDDVLAAHLAASGTAVFRGSEDDVLGRILGAAHAHEATVHVQLWGDNPFLEHEEIDRVVTALLEGNEDLVGNGLVKDRQLPIGLDVIALRVPALEVAERLTRDSPYHREHGTTYVYQTPGAFKIRALETPAHLRYPRFRATLDTEVDYRFAAVVYERLYPGNPGFTMNDLVALVRSQPELQAHPNGAGLAEPLYSPAGGAA